MPSNRLQQDWYLARNWKIIIVGLARLRTEVGLIICQNLKSHREKNWDLKIFLQSRLFVFGCRGWKNALSTFPAGKVPGSRWRICQYSDIVQLLQRSTAGGRRGLIGEEITRFRELFVSTARVPRLASPPNLWRQFLSEMSIEFVVHQVLTGRTRWREMEDRIWKPLSELCEERVGMAGAVKSSTDGFYCFSAL